MQYLSDKEGAAKIISQTKRRRGSTSALRHLISNQKRIQKEVGRKKNTLTTEKTPAFWLDQQLKEESHRKEIFYSRKQFN